MIFHILLTYGRKPAPGQHPRTIPAAASQLAAIDKKFSITTKKDFVVDHARKPIEGLASLPKLKRILARVRSEQRPPVVVDLSWLFSHCPLMCRPGLMTDLLDYGEQVRCRSYSARLADLPPFVRQAIVLNVPPRQPTRKGGSGTTVQERREQTDFARRASIMARHTRSAAHAAHLAVIRDELSGRFSKVTGRMIAEEATRRGHLTSRGLEWRADTVLRALARHDRASNAATDGAATDTA